MGEAKRKKEQKPLVDGNQKAIMEAARRDAMFINLSGRRVGRIYFRVQDMESKPEEIAYVIGMCQIVPLRVECRMDLQQYEMVGMCSQFDRIPDGQPIPVYQLMVEDEGKTIKAIRADHMEEYMKQKSFEDRATVEDEVEIILKDKDGNTIN